jgi:signal transduction histidine kinase/ligand-binding sensor domain-containing protein
MRSHLLALTVLAVLLPSPAAGERLPIRAYTTADGLAHNEINKIVRDSRGFMWFATNDGLSRFDGYAFGNYSVEQGLPHPTVRDLLETRGGELWIATYGGVVRFDPHGLPAAEIAYANDVRGAAPMFTTIVPQDQDPRARAVVVLFESRDGTIWCGTRKGLFRLDRSGGRFELRPVDIGLPQEYALQKEINDLIEDEHGSLWAAAPSGLYRRWRDGTAARYSVAELGTGYIHLHDLMKDREGHIWVGTRYDGFFRISADAGHNAPVIAEHHGYPRRGASWVYRLLETSDGRFWIATNFGLVEFLRGASAGGARFAAYTRRHGLTHQEIAAMAEDAGGNLWLGTWSGAMKLSRNGFITYGREDGVAGGIQAFEDATGQLNVLAHVFQPGLPYDPGPGGPQDEHVALQFGRFDGRRFEWFMPGPPYLWGWAPEGSVLQTRKYEWWLAGGAALFRYPPMPAFGAVRHTKPIRIFTHKDGLPEVQVWRMMEDSRGDVWFSLYAAGHGLFRWNRATDSLTDMRAVAGFPRTQDERSRAFAEDRAGSVWIGLDTGVVRFRDGRFAYYSTADGLPPGAVGQIHAAADGKLWLGSSRGGLIRIDDPTGSRPTFVPYTTAQGLSGNKIEVITEDLLGRIYAATGRGVDQLDPTTGRVKRFTTDDGLAPGWMTAAFRDRTGALWFGTHTGFSRFVPPPPEESSPPSILITGMTVAGERRAVSAIGESSIALPDLPPGGNQLQIEFASIRFGTGERLRYQYRLDGADEDWGPATERRGVTYASLSPGTYRFQVRALNADGVTSPQPAVVTFTVLPPLWFRWWFLSLAAVVVGSGALTLHRYRLARILELERVRTRIATDLHDDVGANLTRIAILSEVARQQRHNDRPYLDAPLSSIADIARESVATMSDIVWAISPERDTLSDMVRRMRDHAEEIFESRDIRVVLDMPDEAQPVRLGVDIRRDVYLVFKEAVSNAARHSRCSTVAIALRAHDAGLSLEITDDGVGFDPARGSEGNGLASMRRRADRLGGTLEVCSAAGAGTSVRFTMPMMSVARA